MLIQFLIIHRRRLHPTVQGKRVIGLVLTALLSSDVLKNLGWVEIIHGMLKILLNLLLKSGGVS